MAWRFVGLDHFLLHSDRVGCTRHGEGGRDHVHSASSLLPRALTSYRQMVLLKELPLHALTPYSQASPNHCGCNCTGSALCRSPVALLFRDEDAHR